MNLNEILTHPTTALSGIVALIIAAVTYYIKNHDSSKSFLKKLFGIEPGAEDLREGLENLSNVVSMQGQTIDWMNAQLELYRTELTDAREKLKEMETIHIENTQLKSRVAELENQVKALEEELARRKKYTPKSLRGDE